MQVALLQINLLVGDVIGNGRLIEEAIGRIDQPVDLYITSELALVGYPAKDLLFNYDLMGKVEAELDRLARQLEGQAPLLVGAPEWNRTGKGKALFNSTFLLHQGRVKQSFQKTLLPNYDVFDEARYFESSSGTQTFELDGQKIGVTICEDIWNDHLFQPSSMYQLNPMEALRGQDVDLIVNLSSSPFSLGKHQQKKGMLEGVSRKSNVPVVYVNQVGGNDDLVFDGRSMAFDGQGNKIARAAAFAADELVVDLSAAPMKPVDDLSEEAEIFEALVLGTRDYVRKCGLQRAVIGLSGGIDSALVAVIATKALGAENVKVVGMPSPFSSAGSVDDAVHLSENLGVEMQQIFIGPMMQAFDDALTPGFGGDCGDLTAQNLQARIRGNLLMAYSNQEGRMLLSTGNKSELSVGYCTIYGDMAGGLSVIADLPKTRVYALCRWINQTWPDLIPIEIIEKAPSAELKPDQLDEDSLPAYDILDGILLRMIERRMSPGEIIDDGFDAEQVHHVAALVRSAEFKRKQAPIPIKIHQLAFGTGWRMPIAAIS